MSVVGEAIIKLVYDGKSAKVSLDKAESEQKSVLSKLGSAAKTGGKVIGVGLAAGYGIASVAIKKFGVEAVKQYANYEQLIGGVSTLFGVEGLGTVEEFAKKQGKTVEQVQDKYDEMFDHLVDVEQDVLARADDAYKTAGMSANEYLETTTSFAASLISSVGGDTEKAAALADRAIQDMSDNANKMGSDMESVQNAYKGFSKGQFNMLDNLKLGYGGTRKEMQRLLEDAEKLTGKKFDIDSYADIVEAIHAIQDNMHITGTTAREASSTISGSWNMLKASTANLITMFANGEVDIDRYVDAFIESFETFADNALPAFSKAIGGIAKALPSIVKKIGDLLPGLLQDILPSLIEATIALMIALTDAIPVILPTLVDGLIQLVQALIPHLPTIFFTLLQAIIQLVVGLFASLVKLTATFLGEVFGKISEWLGQIGPKIAEKFTNIWNGLKEGAKNAWEGIKQVFSKVGEFFGSVFSKAWEAVKKVFSTGGKIFDGIKEGIVNAFKTIVNAIIRGINKVVAIPFGAINGVLNGIRSIDIFGAKPFEWIGTINVPQIPELAKGGVANGRSLATIGEAGKEAVIPLERNTENWARPLAQALAEEFENGTAGREINVYMTNNINNNLDADEIGRRLMTSIRRAV